jgi:hypothetical protein
MLEAAPVSFGLGQVRPGGFRSKGLRPLLRVGELSQLLDNLAKVAAVFAAIFHRGSPLDLKTIAQKALESRDSAVSIADDPAARHA